MNQIEELLKFQDGPNQATKLAIKLGCSEAYVRMLANGTKAPGWRLSRDIETLYNKECEND